MPHDYDKLQKDFEAIADAICLCATLIAKHQAALEQNREHFLKLAEELRITRARMRGIAEGKETKHGNGD